MTPSAPNWVKIKITNWPKKDQWVNVSYITTPDMQTVEEAVKKQSKSEILKPGFVAKGRFKRKVPINIVPTKLKQIAISGFLFKKFFFFNVRYCVNFA